jgi:hypothetical protein
MKAHLLVSAGWLLAIVIMIGIVAVARTQQPEGICFLTVAKSFRSGHAERRNYVINDKSEWESLWAKVVSNSNPNLPLPEIDFTRRTIIGVFEGTQSNSGFEVTIESVVRTDGGTIVFVKELLNPHCASEPVITHPFHIVEIEKFEASQIEFTIKQKVRKCS